MNQGYLIYASGQAYIQQAVLCAMSILVHNPKAAISLVTDTAITNQYRNLFDKIIDIPWHSVLTDSRYHHEHRWKLYHATPYDRTIVLDADTLVLQNLDNWWKYFENYKLYYPSVVYTYRGQTISDTAYRKTFITNHLPNFYNVLHYFEKNDTALEFYNWLQLVSNNWELFYGNFAQHNYPKQASMDVSTAIVSKILHNQNYISANNENIIRITHMKRQIQGWKEIKSNWIKQIGVYLNDNMELIIGNYRQNGIFHYTEQDFVTDQIFNKFNRRIGI